MSAEAAAAAVAAVAEAVAIVAAHPTTGPCAVPTEGVAAPSSARQDEADDARVGAVEHWNALNGSWLFEYKLAASMCCHGSLPPLCARAYGEQRRRQGQRLRRNCSAGPVPSAAPMSLRRCPVCAPQSYSPSTRARTVITQTLRILRSSGVWARLQRCGRCSRRCTAVQRRLQRPWTPRTWMPGCASCTPRGERRW